MGLDSDAPHGWVEHLPLCHWKLGFQNRPWSACDREPALEAQSPPGPTEGQPRRRRTGRTFGWGSSGGRDRGVKNGMRERDWRLGFLLLGLPFCPKLPSCPVHHTSPSSHPARLSCRTRFWASTFYCPPCKSDFYFTSSPPRIPSWADRPPHQPPAPRLGIPDSHLGPCDPRTVHRFPHSFNRSSPQRDLIPRASSIRLGAGGGPSSRVLRQRSGAQVVHSI